MVPLEDVQAAVLAAAPEDEPTEPALSDDDPLGVGGVIGDYDEEEDEHARASDDAAPLELDEVRAAASCVRAATDELPHGFVVSKAKRGRFRRLHHVESCRLVPGVHYKDFDIWGEILPPESEIDAVCGICLKSGVSRAVDAAVPVEEALDSDSSSSSMGSLGASPSKRPRADGPEGAEAPGADI